MKPTWLFAILSFLSLFAILPSLGSGETDADYKLLYSTGDKFIQVWSDHEIDLQRCEWIADRVRKAYTFDSEQEHWSDPKVLYQNPLRVRVVSSIKSKILGYALGKDVFVVRDNYLDDELSEGTLAHELTHIQDARQLKGGKIPSFLAEGRALTNGHNYRMSLGQKDNKYDYQMASSALKYTSADADTILGEFFDTGWDMEAMGTFLVEYMRTKWQGNGIPNVHPRLSKMIEHISTGVDAEAAFAHEFGKPFSELQASFMKYLDDTKRAPSVRLQGTIWASLKAEGASDDDE